VRSAAAINAAIRALLERTRRQFTDEERAEYWELVTEWTTAVAAERCEVVEAA
jgi:hypothetical protein